MPQSARARACSATGTASLNAGIAGAIVASAASAAATHRASVVRTAAIGRARYSANAAPPHLAHGFRGRSTDRARSSTSSTAARWASSSSIVTPAVRVASSRTAGSSPAASHRPTRSLNDGPPPAGSISDRWYAVNSSWTARSSASTRATCPAACGLVEASARPSSCCLRVRYRSRWSRRGSWTMPHRFRRPRWPSRSATTSRAVRLSHTSSTRWPRNRWSAITFVIVWLLPVPGGPWTTSAPPSRARATARAWHGSAAAASHAVSVAGSTGAATGTSARGGASKSTPAVRNARTGPAGSSSIIARVSRMRPWFETGNKPSTAAVTIRGASSASPSDRGAGWSVNAGGGVGGRSPDGKATGSTSDAAPSPPPSSGVPREGAGNGSAMPSASVRWRTRPAISPHGSASSSSSAGGAWPVCCSTQASRAALARTRSPASARPASSTAGVPPAFNSSDTGTNATGARIRFPSPPAGGTDSSGNPTASAATPVSFRYVVASSAITRSLATRADCSRYRRWPSVSGSPSARSAFRGGRALATTRAVASAPSSCRSTSSGVTSPNLASCVRSTRCRLACGRQFMFGPAISPANSRSNMVDNTARPAPLDMGGDCSGRRAGDKGNGRREIRGTTGLTDPAADAMTFAARLRGAVAPEGHFLRRIRVPLRGRPLRDRIFVELPRARHSMRRADRVLWFVFTATLLIWVGGAVDVVRCLGSMHTGLSSSPIQPSLEAAKIVRLARDIWACIASLAVLAVTTGALLARARRRSSTARGFPMDAPRPPIDPPPDPA